MRLTIIWSLVIPVLEMTIILTKTVKRKRLVFVVLCVLATVALKLSSMACACFHAGPFKPFKDVGVFKKQIVMTQQLPSC